MKLKPFSYIGRGMNTIKNLPVRLNSLGRTCLGSDFDRLKNISVLTERKQETKVPSRKVIYALRGFEGEGDFLEIYSFGDIKIKGKRNKLHSFHGSVTAIGDVNKIKAPEGSVIIRGDLNQISDSNKIDMQGNRNSVTISSRHAKKQIAKGESPLVKINSSGNSNKFRVPDSDLELNLKGSSHNQVKANSVKIHAVETNKLSVDAQRGMANINGKAVVYGQAKA